MSEHGAMAAYEAMLEGIGDRAGLMGPRRLASHWPFVGSECRRFLIVGQALAGWDDKTSPALWLPEQAATAAGRGLILDGTRAWSVARPEPIDEPLRTRGHSPFWGVSEEIVAALEPDGSGPWQSRIGWWNLFPVGWDDTRKSPWFDHLWEAQFPHLGSLFWETVDFLDPQRVIILAGAGFWSPTAPALDLADMKELPWPLIAGERRDHRTIVWTCHPGGRYKGLSRRAFATAIAEAVQDLEGTSGHG